MPKLRSFECGVKGTDWTRIVYAFTRSKARYKYWRDVHEVWDGVKIMDVTSRAVAMPQTDEGFANTARKRGVPLAKIGMHIEVGGEPGILVGKNDSANFNVFFEAGQHAGQELNCHPNWMMKYFDADGKVIYDFTKPKHAEQGGAA